MQKELESEYIKTIEFLYSRLPVFHRIGKAAYKEDLNNTIAICNILDNPEKKLNKCIHIAGTNGKGSVSHILSSIFQLCGYKTGLYTSPHLKDFSERIRINGEPIDKSYVIEFVNKYYKQFEPIGASFFELTVGLAFKYFADNDTDINIIETGLGGRLDSTNVINPLLSIITNIDYDHTNLLGDTLEKIAFEKAGIIKNEVPVVIGESNERAELSNSPIYFADKNFYIKNTNYSIQNNNISLNFDIVDKSDDIVIKRINNELKGLYQTKNSITVMQSVEVLNNLGFHIDNAIVKKAFENVVKLSGLRGRWEVLNRNPLTICDTAHNVAGIKEIVKLINQTNYETLHFVIGMVNDKEIDNVLSLLPKDAKYYFCKPNIPRGLDAHILKAKGDVHNLIGDVYDSVNSALQQAELIASSKDFIFVGGSTFVVAEVIK